MKIALLEPESDSDLHELGCAAKQLAACASSLQLLLEMDGFNSSGASGSHTGRLAEVAPDSKAAVMRMTKVAGKTPATGSNIVRCECGAVTSAGQVKACSVEAGRTRIAKGLG